MTSRIPDSADPFEEAGQASESPGLPGKRITGDPQDDMIVPGDEPQGVDEFGTTAEEQREGEPLDLRLSREEPDLLSRVDQPADESPEAADPYPVDHDERVGRITESDEGARPDTEAETVSHDVGIDAGGFTAEERAMHIEPEA
jgi:hypothetical protein